LTRIRNIGRFPQFYDEQAARRGGGPADAMNFQVHHICAAAILCALLSKAAGAQGYPGYPYSIMTPERSATAHQHRVTRHSAGAREATSEPASANQMYRAGLLGRERFISKLHRRGLYAARGSSGLVLPTPLPRTQLIPPEGGGTLTIPSLPQEQGPTLLHSYNRPIPNLPHGPETFQDRASRCSFQSGLYNVPGNLRSQYMGACVQ
jgi:hypothetical protein